MKHFAIKDFGAKSANVWKSLLVERELVVTSNRRPIAIRPAVTENILEETLAAIRRARLRR